MALNTKQALGLSQRCCSQSKGVQSPVLEGPQAHRSARHLPLHPMLHNLEQNADYTKYYPGGSPSYFRKYSPRTNIHCYVKFPQLLILLGIWEAIFTEDQIEQDQIKQAVNTEWWRSHLKKCSLATILIRLLWTFSKIVITYT